MRVGFTVDTTEVHKVAGRTRPDHRWREQLLIRRRSPAATMSEKQRPFGTRLMDAPRPTVCVLWAASRIAGPAHNHWEGVVGPARSDGGLMSEKSIP